MKGPKLLLWYEDKWVKPNMAFLNVWCKKPDKEPWLNYGNKSNKRYKDAGAPLGIFQGREGFLE